MGGWISLPSEGRRESPLTHCLDADALLFEAAPHFGEPEDVLDSADAAQRVSLGPAVEQHLCAGRDRGSAHREIAIAQDDLRLQTLSVAAHRAEVCLRLGDRTSGALLTAGGWKRKRNFGDTPQ